MTLTTCSARVARRWCTQASEVRLHAPRSERRAHCLCRGKLCRSSRGNGGDGPVAGAGAMSIDEAATQDQGQAGSGVSGRSVGPPRVRARMCLAPGRADRLDYEGEVAIILGKSGKDVRAADAKDLVWGVTLLGDWSIGAARRTAKARCKFGMAKNFDQSCSAGTMHRCRRTGPVGYRCGDLGERRVPPTVQYARNGVLVLGIHRVSVARPDAVSRRHHQRRHGRRHRHEFKPADWLMASSHQNVSSRPAMSWR